MAEENQVDISIKLGADIAGGVQTEQELEKVRAKAKKMAEDSKSSAQGAAAGMKNLERSVGFVRKALTGFGVAGMFTALVAGVGKIAESFGAAEKKALDLQKAADEKAFAKSISDLAESYEKLNAQLDAATQKEKDALEIIDMEVKSRRDLQEAKLSAAEAAELAGVDSDAEDAEQRKRVISEKYARIRGMRAASDNVEDLVLQRQKFSKQAEADDEAAKLDERKAADLERKAKQLDAKAEEENIKSTEINEKDKVGVLGYIGGMLRDIFSGNWGNITSATTAEGDAEREKHRSRQEAYEKTADEIREKAEAARASAKAKRESAEQNRRRMTAMNGSIEAAQISEGTTQAKSDASEDEAQRALDKKRAEMEKNAADLARARKIVATGGAKAKSIERQIAANDEQIVAQSYQVAVGGASSSSGASAVEALKRQNAELNQLLSKLLQEIEQSKRVIEKANERTRSARGVDTTEGA